MKFKIFDYLENCKSFSFSFLVIILLVMFYFSSLPGNSIKFGSIWPSIFYHFLIFAVFSLFLFLFLIKRKITKKTIFLTIFLCLFFACLDEFHQIFVPLRDSSFFDILIDITGSIFSISFYLILKKLFN